MLGNRFRRWAVPRTRSAMKETRGDVEMADAATVAVENLVKLRKFVESLPGFKEYENPEEIEDVYFPFRPLPEHGISDKGVILYALKCNYDSGNTYSIVGRLYRVGEQTIVESDDADTISRANDLDPNVLVLPMPNPIPCYEKTDVEHFIFGDDVMRTVLHTPTYKRALFTLRRLAEAKLSSNEYTILLNSLWGLNRMSFNGPLHQ